MSPRILRQHSPDAFNPNRMRSILLIRYLIIRLIIERKGIKSNLVRGPMVIVCVTPVVVDMDGVAARPVQIPVDGVEPCPVPIAGQTYSTGQCVGGNARVLRLKGGAKPHHNYNCQKNLFHGCLFNTFFTNYGFGKVRIRITDDLAVMCYYICEFPFSYKPSRLLTTEGSVMDNARSARVIDLIFMINCVFS